MGSFLSVIGSITLSYLVGFAAQSYMHSKWGSKTPYPPSPSGLPFYWNGYRAFRRDAHKALTAWSEQLHTKLYSVKLFQKRVVVLNSAELVQKALVEKDQYNSSRTVGDPVELLMTGSGMSVFTAPFELPWGRIRRSIHKVVGYPNELDVHLQQQVQTACREIQQLAMEGETLNRRLDQLAFEVGLFVTLGATESNRDVYEKVVDVCEKLQAIRSQRWYNRFSPFLTFARAIGLALSSSTVLAHRKTLLNTLLSLSNTNSGTIAHALHHITPSKNDPEPVPLSEDQIHINLVHLVLHCHQSLSSALRTVVYHLALHPTWQNRIRNDPLLAKAFVAESLRVQPPRPVYSHTTRIEHDFEGYRVDLGTEYLVNLDSIHNDASVYKHPSAFNPDRFLASIQDGKPAQHYTFGAGRRACQGRRISEEVLANMVLAMAQAFDLQATPSTTVANLNDTYWYWTSRTELQDVSVALKSRHTR